MLKLITKSLLVLAILFTVNELNAQKNLKIGVVDVSTIVKEMPEAVEAEDKLMEIGKKYQDTLISMRTELEQRLQQYQKQKSMMPADKQQEEEQMLQALNTQLMQYQEEKFGQQGELNILREQLLEPIRLKVRKAIAEVAKDEAMNFVFDKGDPVLLFSEEKFDITFRVLDKIKRGQEE